MGSVSLKTTTLRASHNQTLQNMLIDNLELSYQASQIFAEQNTTNPGENFYRTRLYEN